MIQRPFWIRQLEHAWRRRSIIWLAGVRRVGKTSLAHMLNGAEYLNCDLPSVGRMLEDPEPFFNRFGEHSTIVFDEVHRVHDPSLLLKIAADQYSHLRVLATGSSTLAATRKFRDALTGRKVQLQLPPVLWSECDAEFGVDLDHRLLRGGLPEALLAPENDPAFFAEWIDSHYARDVQELFAIRNRTGFLELFQLLLLQSGGLTDFTMLAKLAGMSRPTVTAHMEAMTITGAIVLLRPFHGGGTREIRKRPKCYGFDTGFVTHVKGWDSIREEDRGLLWEHLVLDTLRVAFPGKAIQFWRDKSDREIDFVIRGTEGAVHAIECKVRVDRFDPKSLQAFRSHFQIGRNLVIVPYLPQSYERRFNGLKVRFCSVDSLLDKTDAGENDPSLPSSTLL